MVKNIINGRDFEKHTIKLFEKIATKVANHGFISWHFNLEPFIFVAFGFWV